MREMVGTRSRQPSTSLVLARALSDTATLIIKDGRHVGLDFYDLLIEALMGAGHPFVEALDSARLRFDFLVTLTCRSLAEDPKRARILSSLRECPTKRVRELAWRGTWDRGVSRV